MFIKSVGKGKPVLVLHGLLSDHTQVEPLLSALPGCKVFLPDLYGCGQSDKKPVADIITKNVAELKTLCKKEKIETVIGYSTGGLVALHLGLAETIFISSFCTNPLEHGLLNTIKGKEQKIEQLMIRYEKSLHHFMYVLRGKKVPGIKDASVACALQYMVCALGDYRERAAKLKKVLVIHGNKDKLIDVRCGQTLAQASHAHTLFVPEDHYSVLRNKDVHAAIEKFLAFSVLLLPDPKTKALAFPRNS